MFYGSGPFDNMSNHFCLCLSAVAVAIIAIITVHRYYQDEYLNKEGFSFARGRNHLPNPAFLGSSRKHQQATDYITDNEASTSGYGSALNRGQLSNYMNMAYPPGDTHFVEVKGQQCAVSGSNNCPSDLYWKCANRKWSKDAIGEALALSAVGSYYVPSAVEDENMHRIVSLSHDPVTQACRDAGNLPLWNPNAAAPVAEAAMA